MQATLAAPPTFPDLLRNWRKSRKYSQFSLSLSAGVSQKHLSFLESGRSHPSREMVASLSTALDLPLREKNALLNAAGFASIYTQNPIDQEDMKQARRALSVLLQHHEPYPAIVLDRNWNILMMNEANIRLFSRLIDPVEIWQKIGGEQPNLIRACLHPDGLKSAIGNWQEFALYFISQLNRELEANPYNSGAKELLNEVMAYPDVPTLGQGLQSKSLPFLSLVLNVDDKQIEFFSMVSTFGTPLDITLQELRIETFFPVNDQTEDYIQSLKSSG